MARLSGLYLSDERSDVTLVIGDTKIPAHKLILTMSSSYFEALLTNGLAESSQNEVKLQVPLEAFKAILKFIYTGRISLFDYDADQIVEIFDLANMYGFDSLLDKISKQLEYTISVENCCQMLVLADRYSKTGLKNYCLNFFDVHCLDLMCRDTFPKLSEALVYEILKRDTLYAEECVIFHAIKFWYDANPNADIKVCSIVHSDY